MTDPEKNDFINFIYGQLKEREAQNEALHAKLDAQMDRFDKLQATLDAISDQLAESNKMKDVLQKGFDNMYAQLDQMKNELVKTQKDLRKSQREAKKYRELYEVLRDEKFITKSQKSKRNKEEERDDDKDGWDGMPMSESMSSADSNIELVSAETGKPSMECSAEKERPYLQGERNSRCPCLSASKSMRCENWTLTDISCQF